MAHCSIPAPQPQGLMLILSSPSGAGKTTISRMLLERNANLSLSISATTRPKRPGEEHGNHYYFLSEAEFETMVAENTLLEYASVFKNYYGTPRAPVMQNLQAGHDVLFDIDWQGTQQLKLNARQHMVSVFILPPSMAELRRRLLERNADAMDTINYRMSKALDEIDHWTEYDYVLINDDVQRSVTAIEAILCAEKLSVSRQGKMPAFIRSLHSEVPNA